jgi:protein gp37
MADNTHIEWTDATWNPITGCGVVSPGCTNCYAMRLAGTRLQHHWSRKGLTTASKAGPVWNGQVRLNEEWLDQPLRWKRPRRIFVCAHGDLFHESVPDAWIDKVFAVMALAPQHTFQVLTKRAGRMRDYFAHVEQPYRVDQELDLMVANGASKAKTGQEYEPHWPLANVHLGVSVEDQARADERIPILLDTPASVHWVSAEPLLGWLGLEAYLWRKVVGSADILTDRMVDEGWSHPGGQGDRPALDWVVAGGESGPGARPMHPDWVRQIRDDCAAAGVPFLFKQWGDFVPIETCDDGAKLVCMEDGAASPAFDDDERHPVITAHGREFWRIGKRAAGRTLDGVTHDAYPA